ncbi:MAG: putative cadherin domain/calx-beta domain protein [Acidimicrobiales bacterium]|nr:putative cadherin domain/calx-beta domain protein [Acidimicrobiales bacterium]
MSRTRSSVGRIALALSLVVSVGVLADRPVSAYEDPVGREWAALTPFRGLSWEQVAAVCPTDGVTPCSGSIGAVSLDSWIWATPQQVVEVMAQFAPEIASADPPGASNYFGAVSFIGEFGAMNWFSGYNFYFENTAGWTSGRDAAGLPIEGHASDGWWPPSGGLGVSAAPSGAASQDRGVFLWRPAGADYTPPTVTPVVSGTLGGGGWYRSKVALSWQVADAESAIRSQQGCDPQSFTIDTPGTTVTCKATSEVFTGSGSITIKRDATPPKVVCPAPPRIELGTPFAVVTGSVTDALSGATSPSTSSAAVTSSAGRKQAALRGTDIAGNTTTKSCPYDVVVPTCRGAVATIVGTGGNDTINGTADRDVIVGLAGADTINGNGGNDLICGADGPDSINGGVGADVVDGGNQDDAIWGGEGNDDLNGGAGNDSIRGDGGSDRCTSGEARMSSCEVLY